MEINDRVVVITGGGSGIGAAMARRFSLDGVATVVVTDIDDAAAR
ncbi:MAG: SDR family NAD(P)-dependent oxidoreductase, partial [Actinomycetia bacterium]|nr:SDR family NAD(P)-dependent oxidoreductase [Actinomycetes bacterium]